jgi:hypothetical protein
MVLQGILRHTQSIRTVPVNGNQVRWDRVIEDEPAGLDGLFRARARTFQSNAANRLLSVNGGDEQRLGAAGAERPAQNQTAHIRESYYDKHLPTLKLGTLNIVDGRRNRLNAALRCMREMDVDIGLLTETKFATDKYTKYAEGYTVVGTQTNGRQGGVALIYRDGMDGWVLESTEKFGPNVIRTTLVSGDKRWYIIGVYIPPSEEDGKTLDYVNMARESVTNHRWPCIILGDLNVDLSNPGGTSNVGAERREETATLLASLGMKDIRGNFRQRKKKVNRYWTYQKRRENALYGSICDHILSDSEKSFTNCQILNPRFDTDHFALVATLQLGSKRHHRRYISRRMRYPIRALKPEEKNEADEILEELRDHATKREETDGRATSWISDSTWRLIDQRTDAKKKGQSILIRQLKGQVKRALNGDRKARAAAAAESACSLLQEGKIRDAFGAIKGWYKSVGPRPAKPSREELELTRAEYKNLYTAEEPREAPFPVHIEQYNINDGPPTESEVVESLTVLRNHRAAGATGISAENLKDWKARARPENPEEEPDPLAVQLWEKVLELVRLAFVDGIIPQAFTHGILVLIPKDKPNEFRGIALLEVIYKLVSSIINRRIGAEVEFDDAVHGFRKKRGTATAILEVKLLAQMRCRTDEPLFMIFLDLKKAYDTLNRPQAMRILEKYGVGPNIRRIIQLIWEGDTMVPIQAGYYGNSFHAERGVRQGDILSPLIFNIMVDAVVRNWRHIHNPEGVEDMSVFYADDGTLTGTDAEELQRALDTMTRDFKSLGLLMNANKTKFMVMTGGKRTVITSQRAVNRMHTGEGLSHIERQLETILCPECGSEVSRQYLKKHLTTKKCMSLRGSYAPPTPTRARVAAEQSVTPSLEPATYHTSIPSTGTTIVPCPREGCEYRTINSGSSARGQLRKHFQSRHFFDTIIIDEEGLLPQCRQCGFFSKTVTKESHLASEACRKAGEKRSNFIQAMRQVMATERTFTVDGQPIERVMEFKYLGRILEENDDDDPAALRQLKRAREKWGRMHSILKTQCASAETRGYFYKAIIQAVLLYGSESWTLSEYTLRKIRSFHSRVARHLTGRHIRPLENGEWYCPPTADTLSRAGLFTIDEYIQRRRDTIRGFVRPRPIYNACIQSVPMSTNVHKVVWWRLD